MMAVERPPKGMRPKRLKGTLKMEMAGVRERMTGSTDMLRKRVVGVEREDGWQWVERKITSGFTEGTPGVQ